MAIGSRAPLLQGATGDFSHRPQSGRGDSHFTRGALQGGVETQVRYCGASGRTIGRREPHQLALGTVGYEQSREVDQKIESIPLVGAKSLRVYIYSDHHHPAPGVSSRTVRAV
jgi:hypothetical protein